MLSCSGPLALAHSCALCCLCSCGCTCDKWRQSRAKIKILGAWCTLQKALFVLLWGPKAKCIDAWFQHIQFITLIKIGTAEVLPFYGCLPPPPEDETLTIGDCLERDSTLWVCDVPCKRLCRSVVRAQVHKCFDAHKRGSNKSSTCIRRNVY